MTKSSWMFLFFFFSSRRRHTRCLSDWSSDVCSSDLSAETVELPNQQAIELPCHSVGHEAIQARSAGLGAAGNVLVDVCNLPALARSVDVTGRRAFVVRVHHA